MTFGAMAFSTFVFDTLDVSTRLGRIILQELFGWRGRAGAAVATMITLAVPAWMLGFTKSGGWLQFWTLFGASNQLLAALTLLLVTVWLRRAGRPTLHALVPMLFVLGITVWALGTLLVGDLRALQETGGGAAGVGGTTAGVNAAAAAVLLGLAGYLVVGAIRGRGARSPATIREPPRAGAP
jgi:carbon starvation protein